MARLYSNENFPLRVVQELRALGHDVLTSVEAGRANQRIPDEAVLRFATEQKRALLTLNRLDFFRLHRDSASGHSGIIACTQDNDAPALARRIHSAIESYGGMDGQLIRVLKPVR
jgi:hypothetical protein